jgi:hypothetical protein
MADNRIPRTAQAAASDLHDAIGALLDRIVSDLCTDACRLISLARRALGGE